MDSDFPRPKRRSLPRGYSNMANTPSTMGLVRATQPEDAFAATPTYYGRSDRVPNTSTANSPAVDLRKMVFRRANSTPPEFSHPMVAKKDKEDRNGLSSAVELEKRWSLHHSSKKRSQYFEKEFACREPNNDPKERVAKDSVITIDVKLNCCLEGGEQQFHVDLSFALSEIYQRPASCVMIMVCTEVSIHLSGSSDPAYYLTVTALAPEIAATKNKRSAHLIQQFMSEALDIPASRGIVKFESISEGNLATNGLTALQEIEELGGERSDYGLRSMSRQKNRRNKKTDSQTFDDAAEPVTSPPRSFTPFFLRQSHRNATELPSTHPARQNHRTVKKRKSIMSFFGI